MAGGGGPDMEVSDEELMRRAGLRQPQEVCGISSAIVVDNIPEVGKERLAKLEAVVMKIMSRFGTIVGKPYFPIDDNGVTRGYVFLEYRNEKEARSAVETANGYRLDKSHIFTVNLLTDFQKYMDLPDEFTPPEPAEYTREENLRAWLQNNDAHDQYAVLYKGGEGCSIFTNTPNEPVPVHEKDYWTDKYVKWSPQGTYIASLHAQGVILWGGENFSRKRRLFHPNVQMIDFSPCERYMVTFNGAPDHDTDPQAVIIWDVRTGEKLRAFNGQQHKEWPIFKWNFDGSLFARMTENVISVYEAPGCNLLGKESLIIRGVRYFSWSPTDNIIAYWTPEESQVPARVALMELPSRIEIRTMNLFSVADCKIVWHGQGDYLAVKVDRFINNRKKATVANFEVFRMREKQIPVEKLELKDTVQGFAWEPHGTKFAIIHEPQAAHGVSVSFYEMAADKLKHIKTLEKKPVSHIFWSPQGQFVVLAGLKQSNGVFEFYDTSDMTLMNVTEHLMATDVEWDPTGRYVVSQVSWWMQKVDTGYIVWSQQGRLLQRHSVDRFCQLLWRPRPKTLLADEEVKRIKRDRKEYSKIFEVKDRMTHSKASKALVERRRRLMSDFTEYRRRVESEITEAQRKELRGGMDQEDGEFDEEIVEYLVNVDEVILK
ncbi:eukaryotic translation initiation factor 3 subunit B-like [Sycon ciliatum]|uniref:eukaryotic translation initiation factor 3 subunit B-like n=1 Tax=Sycon ciliatum TaxID=27933 RepID=UPI0020A8A58C|eukprot:scpid79153/ scgid15858/ Eukaryotic translation initiation factor 3 subunit B; Eukaryotic translation initiation factor 3 subunit 9; eIF-3-eta